MPKIFELFGYHVGDKSSAAQSCRKAARCPFMEADCDGGGNRYLSHVNLGNNKALKAYYSDRSTVASGVCSIQLKDGERPWIVCPRRLLYLGGHGGTIQRHQRYATSMFMTICEFPGGTRIGIWPELKIKYREKVKGSERVFDYTFDYILMPIGRLSAEETERETGLPWKTLRPKLESSGFTLAKRGSNYTVEDFPLGSPVVIEIMTSSTSGGNKTKRSTIPLAFEDALLGRRHIAPGINYRQVWARMVSQLVVKSEVGLAWGGKTIWVLQDTLVDYISSSTALNIRDFLAKKSSEVNILSLSYGDVYKKHSGVMELERGAFYSGPISATPPDARRPAFQDMIRSPVCPSRSRLIKLLINRKPAMVILSP